MPNEGLRARAVVKRFRGATVLDGVDLDIEPGTITAITGANGAGKTTMLRIFATLLQADAGSAWVDGIDVTRDPAAVRERIGVALVNERALYWRLNGLQNMRFFGRISGVPRRQVKARALEIAAQLGIEPILGRRVSSYSAGQRQRLILGRALIAAPPVLLLDEPLRGLDAEATDRTCAVLRAHAATGATIAIATPSAAEAQALADRAFEIRGGTIAGSEAVARAHEAVRA